MPLLCRRSFLQNVTGNHFREGGESDDAPSQNTGSVRILFAAGHSIKDRQTDRKKTQELSHIIIGRLSGQEQEKSVYCAAYTGFSCFFNADKHSLASSVRSGCVYEQVVKRIVNVRFTRRE